MTSELSNNSNQADLRNGDEAYENIVSYANLIGLSIFSALGILSLWIPYFLFRGFGLHFFAFFGMIFVQSILAGLATGLVIHIDSKLNANKNIRSATRIAIPLIFNILAAGAYFIVIFTLAVSVMLEGYIVIHNHNLTIKEEDIRPRHAEYAYHAILHLKNNSRIEIKSLSFYLTPYQSSAMGSTAVWHFNAADSSGRIPVDSDIEINIPITTAECDNGTLEKPLFLEYKLGTYSTDGENPSLAISDDIRQQIAQLVCGSAP